MRTHVPGFMHDSDITMEKTSLMTWWCFWFSREIDINQVISQLIIILMGSIQQNNGKRTPL